MAKTRSEPSFADRQKAAKEHIQKLRSQFGDTQFYARLVWDGFASAYHIALNRGYYPSFASDLAVVFAHCDWRWEKDKEAFWRAWPTKGPYTFGFYQFAGNSALKVAARFAQSIRDAATIVSVSKFKTFEFGTVTDAKIESLATALAKNSTIAPFYLDSGQPASCGGTLK